VIKQKPTASVVDLDDTIFLFSHTILEIANIVNKTTVNPSDLTEWDLPTEINSIYKRFECRGLYNEMELIPFALDALTHLKLVKGHKIVLLTARDPKFGEETYLHLIKNKVPFDELIFEKDKVKEVRKISKRYHISLFIDDKYETVQSIYEKCAVDQVCLVNMPHNKNKEADPDIVRISNLLEAIKYIK